MKQHRVKLFEDHVIDELEISLNSFLNSMDSEKINEIKFTQSEDDHLIHYAAMVIYEIDT